MALKYIYDNHLDDADWFLKADDDTYVIMENLRYFLHQYSPDIPIYFGCKFNRYIRQGYMSGGAGYVMSKRALEKFATEAYDNSRRCKYMTIAEDQQLGICMENIGVIAGDSRDENGLERFIPLPPDYVLPVSNTEWYTKWVYHEPEKNVSCCSPLAISFHYISPDDFYVLEYLLYTLKAFGVVDNRKSLPPKQNISHIYAAAIPDALPLITPPTVGSNG
ncbi:glycoprotein-N-acetylgalactosamine 3-beta-galactosyltransferase 1-like [Musca autumnalis]|uniref:glycoprotein-N-acetylgalactosamine 3-beta-galactosyltransferase 1-like n=1 Tax=Musca autumnalis TaxID=221902 RepID=UPI003CF7634B